MEPIMHKGATWSHQWHVREVDGADIDLTDATYEWCFDDATSNVESYTSADDADRFEVVDAEGEDDATGPFVRVNVTTTFTAARDAGWYTQQMIVTLADGRVLTLGDEPVRVLGNGKNP